MGFRENEIATAIIKACICIHEALGPGLLESVYERCLHLELLEQGFQVKRQWSVPVIYRGEEIGDAFHPDLIVDDLVIVELKSVESLNPVHFKTLLTYLRLADKRLGLLINFNEELLKNGIKRVVNGLRD